MLRERLLNERDCGVTQFLVLNRKTTNLSCYMNRDAMPRTL